MLTSGSTFLSRLSHIFPDHPMLNNSWVYLGYFNCYVLEALDLVTFFQRVLIFPFSIQLTWIQTANCHAYSRLWLRSQFSFLQLSSQLLSVCSTHSCSGVSQRLRLSLNMEFKVLFLYLPHFWGFLHILQQLWLLQAFSPCFSTQRGDGTFSWLPSASSFATTTSTAAASREEQKKTSHLLQMLTPLKNLSSFVESPKPSNRFSPLECISVI